jgi:hypothetical protein
MYSGRGNAAFATLGFPIRTSPAQRSVGNSPELFAATHVLLRLLAPRHPPHALSSLLTLISRGPASRRSLKTRDQGPGPGSSPRTRKKTSCLSHRFQLTPRLSAPGKPSAGDLNFSAEIEFYPSYALVKERSDDFSRQKLVELIGFEPTTSSLQS